MALSAGSIAFTGFNGDGNDNLSFVALADIPQGTVINFTDSNWNGTSFASGSNAESTIAWTATNAVAAGTVININNIGGGSFGVSAGSATFTNANNTGLSNDSEVVYAYVGSAGAPTFLAAISNVGFSSSDGTLTGTGLVAGQTAIGFSGGLDIMAYNGVRSGQAGFAGYLAAINNTANWITQNGSGNQSTDGTAPDAPFPTTMFTVAAPSTQSVSFSPASVSVNEGDSGTRTMTFTVQRTGGTTGAVNFSGTFAAGSTNAADYGGTLPGATFSGTIAAGANSATVTITISGDTMAEPDESFTLTLTSATNPSATVTLGTTTATGTITNDDGTVLSSNSSTPVTLANNDHLTIFAGVTLSGATPVTWVGGSTAPGAVLDNFGTISGSNRAVATSGSASGSLTINNKTGATITAIKDAVKISNLAPGTSGTLTINNDGTIASTGIADDAGQALDLNDINSSGAQTVINNAATGVISAADADAVRAGARATINNYGRIVSHNGTTASTGNDAIDFQSSSAGVINNFAGGTIEGARHAITGDLPITVTNDGTIIGNAGSGINMDSAGTTTVTVINRGTITGTAVNGADADGIDVDGLVAIDNDGTIQALGLTSSANGLNEALAIGGGTVHNRSGGLITSGQRAITVDDSNGGNAFAAVSIINEGTIRGLGVEAIAVVGTFGDELNNSGEIDGSVDLGGGTDTLTNSGGLAGDVNMGAGNDIVNLLAGASSFVTGTIDGGDGDDTLTLSSPGPDGAGVLGDVVNVEHLHVAGGAWTVQDATQYADVTVDGGARLNVRGAIDGATVGQGGVMDVYGTGSASGTSLSGTQYLESGATATDTIIAAGGDQTVFHGASASGTAISGGSQIVYGSADETAIGSGGVQSVYGTGTDTTIGDGGLQKIYTDGTATGSTLNAGAVQVDWGTAIDTTINGGNQYVVGNATETTIVTGIQYVESGGLASGTTIDDDGEQSIYEGGLATGTSIEGGDQIVYGSATDTTIETGGLQYLHGMATGTVINDGGEQNVYGNGTATGTTVNVGGIQVDWGVAVDTTINGGKQFVVGTASDTTILSGVQHVLSGGVANDTTIDTGGTQYVHAGGAAHDVTFAGAAGTLALDESSGFTGTISGWEFGDRIDLGDIVFNEATTTLAYSENATQTGGTLTVSDGLNSVSLSLLGQYSAADFAASADGHGGTLITDPTPEPQIQLVAALA